MIYLKPEQGAPFQRSLPVQAIIGSIFFKEGIGILTSYRSPFLRLQYPPVSNSLSPEAWNTHILIPRRQRPNWFVCFRLAFPRNLWPVWTSEKQLERGGRGGDRSGELVSKFSFFSRWKRSARSSLIVARVPLQWRRQLDSRNQRFFFYTSPASVSRKSLLSRQLPWSAFVIHMRVRQEQPFWDQLESKAQPGQVNTHF